MFFDLFDLKVHTQTHIRRYIGIVFYRQIKSTVAMKGDGDKTNQK